MSLAGNCEESLNFDGTIFGAGTLKKECVKLPNTMLSDAEEMLSPKIVAAAPSS